MLDRNTIEQIIREYEQMISIMTNRVQEFKRLIGVSSQTSYESSVPSSIRDTRKEIEKRRQEAMAEAEMMRQKAMEQMKQMGNGMPNMPSVGMMTGMGMVPPSMMPNIMPESSKHMIPHKKSMENKDDE